MIRTGIPYCKLCGKVLYNRRKDAIYCDSCMRDKQARYSKTYNQLSSYLSKCLKHGYKVKAKEKILDMTARLYRE